MADDLLKLWKEVETPPIWAVKEITGGRLKGMTDINPQWRYKVLTEKFGVCGSGWKYIVNRIWTEQGTDGQVFAFAEISLYIKNEIRCTELNQVETDWSNAIPGIGGSMLIEKESKGLYHNDEAFKMAITDALSVACKMLGIGASVYSGSKYDPKKPEPPRLKPLTAEQYFKYGEHLMACETLKQTNDIGAELTGYTMKAEWSSHLKGLINSNKLRFEAVK